MTTTNGHARPVDLKEMHEWLFMTYTGKEEVARRMKVLLEEIEWLREENKEQKELLSQYECS